MLVSGNYDRIARFYDVDMGRNMAFDDVGFYVAVCQRRQGRVLEMGCGNGRVLLELLDRGADAIGVDSSAAMLRELQERAASRGVDARVCQMDMRAVAFRRAFEIVLCPYSLVNYLTADDDLNATLKQLHGILVRDGLLVIDTFVPRPIAEFADFRLDYRRPFGEHYLTRSRRVAPRDDGVNRIERRYQLVTDAGEILEQIDVVEEIRPFEPEELEARLADAGFVTDQIWWNYAVPEPNVGAQFYTVVARMP